MKIRLLKVNYGEYSIGAEISAPKDITRQDAILFLDKGWAEIVEGNRSELVTDKFKQQLEEEHELLKKQAEDLKIEKPDTMTNLELVQAILEAQEAEYLVKFKAVADHLQIKYNPNIGIETLSDRILEQIGKEKKDED